MSPMTPPSEIGIKGYRIIGYQSKRMIELLLKPEDQQPKAKVLRILSPSLNLCKAVTKFESFAWI
jgi:hypothetical protein